MPLFGLICIWYSYNCRSNLSCERGTGPWDVGQLYHKCFRVFVQSGGGKDPGNRDGCRSGYQRQQTNILSGTERKGEEKISEYISRPLSAMNGLYLFSLFYHIVLLLLKKILKSDRWLGRESFHWLTFCIRYVIIFFKYNLTILFLSLLSNDPYLYLLRTTYTWCNLLNILNVFFSSFSTYIIMY